MACIRARRARRHRRCRVTPGTIDAYLRELEHELRRRGAMNARIIDETREHLADAMAEAQERGLSMEEATREALMRFGAPQIIATQVEAQRKELMSPFASRLWHRKWWVLTPTLLTALATTALSYYFLPARYRSESSVRVIVPGVPPELRPASDARTRARLQQISQTIVTRPNLERVIRDFGLYEGEQGPQHLGDAIVQMQRDINVTFETSGEARDEGVGVFNVSFVAGDPTLAMKITGHIARLIIEENLRETERQSVGASQFIESQINDVRERLIAYETKLNALSTAGDRRPLSQADLLPYEVLKERYKTLLMTSERTRIATNMERGQMGEQFVIIDPPQKPDRPLGPSRLDVSAIGTLAGLGVGLVLGVWGRKPALTTSS